MLIGESTQLAVEVHANGRVKVPVTIWRRGTEDTLVVDVVDLVSDGARATLIDRLPEGLREEAVPLLTSLAVELMRQRGSQEKATPESRPPAQVITLKDPDACPDPVDGAQLLDDLVAWLIGYVHQPKPAAVAEALWSVATWFVDELDYAPVLTVISATKRCGKTHLLHLLKPIARRGYATSGSGVTTAVVFRINDRLRPTLCIDEAERLAGRHADRELIGMLNAGYRRGARVQRCVEHDGDFEVVDFDAYGFRALAAIGRLWDTIMDRAITIRLERRPAEVKVRRFAERVVEQEGLAFARRIRRWADEHRDQVAAAALETPRPDWLDDRACDNWSGLLAVAAVAGGPWLEQALATARTLTGDNESADHTELLIHDVARRWDALEWGEAVKSGDLVAALNDIEGSPWGEYRDGKGLTTHRLAAMLKPLGVRPELRRTSRGEVLRGYWWRDIHPVLLRYPIPPEVLQPLPLIQESPGGTSSVSVVSVVTVEAEKGKADQSVIPLPDGPPEEDDEPDPEGLFGPETEP